MGKLHWPPSEKVLKKMERMGVGGAIVKMPAINLYCLDQTKRFNPTYIESSLLYGNQPTDNQTVGETGTVYDGPYGLRGLYQLKPSDIITTMTDENGNKYSASMFMINVPRQSLREASMIDVPVEEKIRMPATGDIVEILDVGNTSMKDLTGGQRIGPYYFVIADVNYGKTIDFTDYWIELILTCESTTKFDPARMLNTSSQFIPISEE